jgi:hypothetical protein
MTDRRVPQPARVSGEHCMRCNAGTLRGDQGRSSHGVIQTFRIVFHAVVLGLAPHYVHTQVGCHLEEPRTDIISQRFCTLITLRCTSARLADRELSWTDVGGFRVPGYSRSLHAIGNSTTTKTAVPVYCTTGNLWVHNVATQPTLCAGRAASSWYSKTCINTPVILDYAETLCNTIFNLPP